MPTDKARREMEKRLMRPTETARVSISLDDYSALKETSGLLRSPANACRLLQPSINLNPGKAK